MTIKNLVQHFGAVEDPRCRGKIRHRLEEILVIAVCAVIAWIRTFSSRYIAGSPQSASPCGSSGLPSAARRARAQKQTVASSGYWPKSVRNTLHLRRHSRGGCEVLA
jgi:DDE family transposase